MKISVVVGNAPMFKYLANEINNSFQKDNIQIIVEDSYSKENFKKQIKFRIKKYGLIKFVDEVIYRLFESIIQKASGIYKKYFYEIDSLKVDYISSKINNSETEQKIKEFSPDILIVFGTSIVKKNIFSIPTLGTLNVHPGINPKYKGAGSFWAMKNRDFTYYGFTIHLVDEGIDTGDIVSSKKLPFAKKHKVLPEMYSKFTIEATKELINVLKEIKQTNTVKKITPLTNEEGYNTWVGMSDYVSMRWKNRNV
jgi:folate-dependent phosphoribosylglycinamide formyltransferase PurN